MFLASLFVDIPPLFWAMINLVLEISVGFACVLCFESGQSKKITALVFSAFASNFALLSFRRSLVSSAYIGDVRSPKESACSGCAYR
jgi:hypothetical protein